MGPGATWGGGGATPTLMPISTRAKAVDVTRELPNISTAIATILFSVITILVHVSAFLTPNVNT